MSYAVSLLLAVYLIKSDSPKNLCYRLHMYMYKPESRNPNQDFLNFFMKRFLKSLISFILPVCSFSSDFLSKVISSYLFLLIQASLESFFLKFDLYFSSFRIPLMNEKFLKLKFLFIQLILKKEIYIYDTI